MTDLKIDYAALDRAHGALKAVADALDCSEARRDELDSCWGGSEVRRAMRGFVDDWDRHRHKLVVSLREMSDKSAGVAETFRDVEAALGAGLSVGSVRPGAMP